ncbi:MAG: hypothetical protein O3C25_03615 [Chloroflexi bacterium]|nr:hypothetical protein [Chloroflexota bacterium]
MVERALALLPPDRRVTAWALGTAHAALLTLVPVLLVFRGGGLGDDLEGLSTAVGLALYALLWAVSLLGTVGALRRIGPDVAAPTDSVVAAGALWGGVAGAAFLVVGLVALASYATAEGIAQGTVGPADIVVGAAGVAAIAVIGGAFAFIGGAMVGALVALVDVALLAAARAVVTAPRPRE